MFQHAPSTPGPAWRPGCWTTLPTMQQYSQYLLYKGKQQNKTKTQRRKKELIVWEWPAGIEGFSKEDQRDARTKHPKQKAFLSISPALVFSKSCGTYPPCPVKSQNWQKETIQWQRLPQQGQKWAAKEETGLDFYKAAFTPEAAQVPWVDALSCRWGGESPNHPSIAIAFWEPSIMSTHLIAFLLPVHTNSCRG